MSDNERDNEEIAVGFGVNREVIKRMVVEGLIPPKSRRDYLIYMKAKREIEKGRVKKDVILDIVVNDGWGISESLVWRILNSYGL